MEFWALVTLATQIFGQVHAKVELVKQIWAYLQLFPEWRNYLKELDEKLKTLQKKQEELNSLEEDNNETLKNAELKPGKKRKREVEDWLRNVERKRTDVRNMEQEISETKYFLRPWLGSCIDRNLQEVEELKEQGRFPEGLFLNVHPTSKEPLPTQALVGKSLNLETIMDWLNDSSVSRIGVYGVNGVGKTTILMHIWNQLLSSSNTFENVYWVTVPKKPSIQKLQDVIAKQVGLDLSGEEDRILRQAKLHKALTLRKKCVIVLNGFCGPFVDEVGIPNEEDECKLIMSAMCLRDCLRVNCQKTLEIKPLSGEEARELFMEKLCLRFPLGHEIEDSVDQIVEECQGLPRLIVNVAVNLRGVNDIVEWRNKLTEMTNYRNGEVD